jgi:hypothetical protein
MSDASEPGWRQDQRHRCWPSEDRGRRIDIAHIPEHAWLEFEISECRDVTGECPLVFRSPIDVVENPEWKSPLGYPAVVIDTCRLLKSPLDRIKRDRIELHDRTKRPQHSHKSQVTTLRDSGQQAG